MLLPTPPRRNHLRSFGIACTAVLEILLAVLATAAPAAAGPGLAIAAAVVLLSGAIALVRPAAWSWPYHAWSEVAEHARAAVLLYLLGICYFLILPVAGWAGARLVLRRADADDSMWSARTSLARDAYLTEDHAPPGPTAQRVGGYVAWLRRSGGWWALSLLPLLKLIEAHGRTHAAPPANIYTLY